MIDATTRHVMATKGERLRKARIEAGYLSAAELARKLKMPEVTVRAHEKGDRAYNEAQARRYAKELGVNWVWLLTESGDKGIPHAHADAVERRELANMIMLDLPDEDLPAVRRVIEAMKARG